MKEEFELLPRWRHRQKLFTSLHNQKEDNNQAEINKQPKVPENQTAWNSNNKGIKEKINQNNQTGKEADGVGKSEKPRHHSRPWGQGWLPALRAAREGLT